MSRGKSFSRFNAAGQTFLEVDIGPVEADAECAVGLCDDDAVYRVPWPQFGGDVAYYPCHLARYRTDYRDQWQRIQDRVDDDLSEELQAHVKSRLAKYEYPRELEFVSELPKTTTGKVRRYDLRVREGLVEAE